MLQASIDHATPGFRRAGARPILSVTVESMRGQSPMKKTLKKAVTANATKKRAGNQKSRAGRRLQRLSKAREGKIAGAAPADLRHGQDHQRCRRAGRSAEMGAAELSHVESKSGSTIRIDQVKAEAGQYAVYFHCQTDLVETFRELYPELRYGGNRSTSPRRRRQAARDRAAPLRGAGADVSFAEAQGCACRRRCRRHATSNRGDAVLVQLRAAAAACASGTTS